MSDSLSCRLSLIAEAVLDSRRAPLDRPGSGAESALAAPFANFAGIDFYDEPVERAAICCSRIIRNHPLPDGNKRVGYECMREMLERGGFPWPRPSEDAEEIAGKVEALAAREISERDFVQLGAGRGPELSAAVRTTTVRPSERR